MKIGETTALLKDNNDMKLRHLRTWLVLAAAGICAVYALILANRSLAPTEGWYSYYAYIMNEQGAVPYLDFELLFPPLYIYLIAGFTAVFGYDIIALRLLGVVIFALIGALATLIFERLTEHPIFSLFAGVLTALTVQSEAVQIFYDYIRFMDVSVYASVYFFLRYFTRADEQAPRKGQGFLDADVILGSVFAVCASMFKQSSGLIYLLFCFVFFIFLFLVPVRRKDFWRPLLTLTAVTALLYGGMVLFLFLQGSLSSYFFYNFKAATAAKGGSLVSILFGWMGRTGSDFIVGMVVALLMLVCLGALVFFSCRFPEREGEEKKPTVFTTRPWLAPLLFALTFVGNMVLFALLFWRQGGLFYGAYKMFAVFLFSAVIFAAMGFSHIFRKHLPFIPRGHFCRFFFFTGTVTVLGFSVCTSGGVVESQLALGYPLIFALALPFLTFHKKEIAAFILAFLMCSEIGFAATRKYARMYGWWGLDVGAIWDQTEKVEGIPILKGLRMDKNYATMYTDVSEMAEKYTREGDEIFVFPHMPILYLVADRPRATNTAIQWFDVATDAGVVADIEVLQEKKPKMLVLCPIDPFVCEAHESSFREGEKSGLSKMQRFLNEFVMREGYTQVTANRLSNGYVVEIWVRLP